MMMMFQGPVRRQPPGQCKCGAGRGVQPGGGGGRAAAADPHLPQHGAHGVDGAADRAHHTRRHHVRHPQLRVRLQPGAGQHEVRGARPLDAHHRPRQRDRDPRGRGRHLRGQGRGVLHVR